MDVRGATLVAAASLRRGDGASRRFNAALSYRIRVRNIGGVCGGYGENLVPIALAPTFLFIALRDGAYQP
jgi:hypothetical protein